MAISVNDFLICLWSAMEIPTMFIDRKPMLLAGKYTCVIWMNLYQAFTRLSIALTATLSVTRTVSIIWPMSYGRYKKRIFIVLYAYIFVILLFTIIPCALNLQYGTYDKSGAMCWLLPRSTGFAVIWDHIDNVIDCMALAGPIIPIFISCIISIYKVSCTSDIVVNQSGLKRQATITIIIFTVVYFIFNIPLFILYIFWFITAAKYTYPGPYFSSNVMYNYSWNFTETLSVALNSTANPIIYFLRIRNFRNFVLNRRSLNRQSTFTLSNLSNNSNQDQGGSSVNRISTRKRRITVA